MWHSGKESTCQARDARDVGSIPGSGRSPGVGNSNPLKHFGLENSMDGGAWQATVHRVTKSSTEHSTVNQFIWLPFSCNSICTTGVSLHWKYPHVTDDWSKSHSSLHCSSEEASFQRPPGSSRKGVFCSGDPKLPRVMQNNLSFVFQPLWGHLGQWLFEDLGGLCWAPPGIHPQDSGL